MYILAYYNIFTKYYKTLVQILYTFSLDSDLDSFDVTIVSLMIIRVHPGVPPRRVAL